MPRFAYSTLAAATLFGLCAFWLNKALPAFINHTQEYRQPVEMSTQQAGKPAPPALSDARQSPMYLLLTVEGLAYCPEGETAAELADPSAEEWEAYCARNDFDNAKPLAQLLDAIEPGGAQGRIQVGYVLTTKLLSLYKRAEGVPGGWAFDARDFARQLRLIEKIDRPVALYLSSTHFDTLGPLPEALAQDAANLALFPDLQPTTLSYFSYPIVPYTLQTGAEIAVNRYRRQALAHIHALVQQLAPEHRRKIVAIFLGGETHQFYQGFEDGMGQFERPVVTDYSPASQQQFRAWLVRRHGDLQGINKAWGSAFESLEAIAAPAGNFRDRADTPVFAHYDGYSQGTLPVHGWFWDPSGSTEALRVYVDGQYVADAQMGLNRLDVYRAVEGITSPAVGFRFDLPFDRLPAGKHMVSVTHVQGEGKSRSECLIDERVFEVLGRAGQAQQAPFDFADKHRVFTSMRGKRAGAPRCNARVAAGKRHYLDSPAWELKVGFNPVAHDWNLFRQAQVQIYMQQLYDWAAEIGYDTQLLFSHQIVPELNSSWNENLFATQNSVSAIWSWKPGFNLYGAGVWSPWTRDFLARLDAGEAGYGVPEFHPQQWKDAHASMEALVHHFNAGAHFLSPYYFSITPKRYLQDPTSNAVARMRLEPGNPADGSDLFYEAIVDLAKE